MRVDANRCLPYLHCILAICLIPAAIYGSMLLYKLNNTAADSPLITQQTLNLIGSATSLIGNSYEHKDGTLFGTVYQLGEVAKAGQSSVQQLGALTGNGSATLEQSTQLLSTGQQLLAHADAAITHAEPALSATRIKLDNIIDTYATLPPHLNQTADNAAEVLNTLNDFAADARTAEARDRFSQLLEDLHPFTTGATRIEGDIHAYIKPYDGAHPKRHAIWQFAQSTLGIGSKGAQIAYHGIGAAKGQ